MQPSAIAKELLRQELVQKFEKKLPGRIEIIKAHFAKTASLYIRCSGVSCIPALNLGQNIKCCWMVAKTEHSPLKAICINNVNNEKMEVLLQSFCDSCHLCFDDGGVAFYFDADVTEVKNRCHILEPNSDLVRTKARDISKEPDEDVAEAKAWIASLDYDCMFILHIGPYDKITPQQIGGFYCYSVGDTQKRTLEFCASRYDCPVFAKIKYSPTTTKVFREFLLAYCRSLAYTIKGWGVIYIWAKAEPCVTSADAS